MSYHQTRQMPIQVQKSLREASLRSMEIQKQLAKARCHQEELTANPPLQVRILGKLIQESPIVARKVARLEEFSSLCHN
ncbi:hypothetical protein [Giesbergeria anulus]|uniref:Uncharacterized protein n=1 Tax=Giesbergeria anulus TaxID=180197 RepID=A0A1H9RQF3_9BURK|nr:hypothetical protein [Giesbergeria anulus]SER74119.1 hypothetical protein SAMN02982919_02932 [Giesbergeria anulus]